jgi:hypothetical protein
VSNKKEVLKKAMSIDEPQRPTDEGGFVIKTSTSTQQD